MDHSVRMAWLACCLAGLSGCNGGRATAPGNAAGNAPTGKYTIVTTCGMVTDIVDQVAGDRANVVGLMGTGVDPHMHKPGRSDIDWLTKADVIFYSGLMLEGKMTDLFSKMSKEKRPVYAVTAGVDKAYLREPPEFEGHFDPHVWMDVSAWSECVAFVAETLGTYDPSSAAVYQANAERYREQLQSLEQYVRQSIQTIPADQRVLITAHDAFGYFGRAYGIEVRSVQGLSTESAAAVDDINRLVDFIVNHKITAIFVESSVSSKNIEAIIEGAAHRGWQVETGGELYSDAMGPPGSYEGTYIGMIDHNATVITRALGGDAPARGWQDKLSP